jgi:integrase
MLTNALTTKQVEKAKEGKIRDGQGLTFEVKGGSRRWVFDCMWQGKRLEIAVGKFPAMTLAEAREIRSKLRDAKDHGIDPRTVLNTKSVAVSDAITFKADMEAFYEKRHREWDAVHARIWKNSLTNHAASLMGKPTASLTDADVLEVVKPLWTTKYQTGSDVLGRIRVIIEYATGLDPKRFTLPNPTLRARLVLPDGVRPETVNLPSMPFLDLPAFYARLAVHTDMAARALQFLLLNGSPRSAEVLGATWGEIQGDLWHVPASHTKSGNPRTNKLTQAALDVLAAIKPDDVTADKPIFHRERTGLGHHAMLNLLRDMGHEALTVHGFRASFTGWVKRTHRRHAEEAETLLDHKTTGPLGRAYDREDLLDERFELCGWWADFLTSAEGQEASLAA